MKTVHFRLLLFCFTILFIIPVQALVSDYGFLSYQSMFYNEITGGALLGNESTQDERFTDPAVPLGTNAPSNLGPGFPIGFNFSFNGYTFDRIALNANGWISLGQSALGNSAVNIGSSITYEPISSTMAITPVQLTCRIAGFACDIQAQTGASLRIQTLGTAPFREFVIQWKNYKRAFSFSSVNFQIRLFETTNNIQIIYGTFSHGTGSTLSHPQVGLRGSDYTDFVNRTTTSDWAATTPGISNYSTCIFNQGIMPVFKQTYDFSNPMSYGYDLMALSMTFTNYTPSVHSPTIFTLTVKNRGTVTVSGYTIKLMSGTTELVSLPGNQPLQPQEIIQIPITYTFSDTGPIAVYGKVDNPQDDDTNNNMSPTFNLTIQPPETNLITIGHGEQMASAPMDMSEHNSLYECLYYPNELNLTGQINAVTFFTRFNESNPFTAPVKIWLGETTAENLASGWIPSYLLTSVFDGSVNFPTGQNPVTINFTTPYNYSGNNNLVLLVSRADGNFYSTSDRYFCQTVGTNRSRNYYDNYNAIDPANPPTTNVTISGTFPKTAFLMNISTISVTGTVAGADAPSVGLNEVQIELSGPQTYSGTSNTFGQFTLTNVLANRQYNYSITHQNYQTDTGTFTTGSTNYDMGVIILSEIAYPPVSFTATLTASYAFLDWSDITNYPNIAFKIWRLEPGQENNLQLWILLTPNPITASEFTDTGWPGIPNGYYKWAVSAVYLNNVISEPTFSNELLNLSQSGTISGTVRKQDQTPFVGARIDALTATAFTNADGQYSLTAPAWSYTVLCSAFGYFVAESDSIDLGQGLEATLDFVLQPGSVWTDGFENYQDFAINFPPWVNVDMDKAVTLYDYSVDYPNDTVPKSFIIFNPSATTPPTTFDLNPHSGSKSAQCFSTDHFLTSQTNNDWLISPPFGRIGQNAEFNFWARSLYDDPTFWERFRVLISSGQNDPAKFIPLSAEPYQVAPNLWTPYTFAVPDSLYGKVVRVAINCISEFLSVFFVDDFTFNPGTVASEDPLIPVLQTILSRNYPNPFNPETTISYAVKGNLPVLVEVYNLKGQKVKTLVNETKKSGQYEVTWNGTDHNNQKVTSGVYLYKMSAGKYSSTRKMIMLK